MCGIIAALSLSSSLDHDAESQLRKGLRKIVHRGPDGEGIWLSENRRCGLAHCRLSINDLSPAGAQPLHSSDRTVHAIVNGELYDDGSLRSSLSTSYEFTGHSDSELAIALYKKHGIDFLSYLRGEFALCLYDEEKDVFIAARDRYGIKPLFWRRSGNEIWLGAEIKAFLGTGWVPEWDVEALVSGSWGHTTRTVFKSVQKLRPGHFMYSQGGSEPETRSYWDINYPDKTQRESRTETEMISELREHLIDAVRLRLRADVPVGIYLSGGIDSSALAGIATHLVEKEGLSMGSQDPTQRICCFSIGFDEETGFDESSIAQRTADWLGVSFLKAHMSETELASRFEDATYHVEHHYHDLNYIGKYALSEVPREHGYKVVLTGEGADEQFAGYPLYQPDFVREPDCSIGRDSLTAEERETEVARLEDIVKESYDIIGGVSSPYNDPALHTLNHLTIPAAMSAFLPSTELFTEWTRRDNPVETIINNLSPSIQQAIRDRWHPINSAMYVWSKGNLVNLFLSCLGDRVEMSHSVEARTPFLDHILTQYINQLPPSIKIKTTPNTISAPLGETGSQPSPTDEPFTYTEKYALREAVKPFVTEEVYKRRKYPYSAPPTFPLNGPIHKKLEELVTKERVEVLGFIRWVEVEKLMSIAFEVKGNKDKDKEVWAWRQLVIIAQWVVLSRTFGIRTASPTECR